MRLRSCSRREDVNLMLRQGHWPEGCEDELREHIAGCDGCRQWISLTRSFQRARAESVMEARVGGASLLWWKAELRRRDAVLKKMSRPTILASSFALAVGAAAACGLFLAERSAVLGWFEGIGQAVVNLQSGLPGVLSRLGPGESMMLGCAFVAVAVLGGLVYAALDRP